MTATEKEKGDGASPRDDFVTWMERTVHRNATREFVTWYDRAGKPAATYTFGKLWEEAGLVARCLLEEWNVSPRDRVVLCYAPGLHFLTALIGCFRAGVTAVLVYPPAPGKRLGKDLAKMAKTVADCRPVLVLCDEAVKLMRLADQARLKRRGLWPDLPFRSTQKLSRKNGRRFGGKGSPTTREGTPSDEHRDDVDDGDVDLAFLQYTSGSTGDPKGVMVDFAALAANVELIRHGYDQCFKEDPYRGITLDNAVGFSWLPQYHDLGLIYASIAPFLMGMRMHMMSPATFIQDPLLWVRLMARHGVNWGVAPDFAYSLVARRCLERQRATGGDDPALRGLDLSRLHNLQTGAEPVRPSTKARFEAAFRDRGLRDNWFHAGYGLAENVVGVSWIHGYHLSPPPDGGAGSPPLVAVGCRRTFHASLDVRIVDPQTRREVPRDGVVGELWIGGPSVAAGYFGKPALTAETFRGCLAAAEGDVVDGRRVDDETYLRTGDMAFFDDAGRLYICGRIKDLIIINGVNYWPQDVELIVQNASSAVRPGCVAAFSSDDVGGSGIAGPGDAPPSMEIVFEVRKSQKGEAAELARTVRRAVLDELGVMPSRVVAIKEKTIPKTTSGKIRRKTTRSELNSGALSVVAEAREGDLDLHSSSGSEFKLDSTQRTELDVTEKASATAAETVAVSPEDRYKQILGNVLGKDYDPSLNWEENGLSSIQQVELVNQLSAEFPATIPSDFSSKFTSPAALKDHIFGTNAGAFFPTETESLPSTWIDRPIHRTASAALQAVGVALLLMLLTISALPPYHLVVLAMERVEPGSFGHGVLFPTGAILLPPVFLVWQISFSLMVILLKWVVIGRYKARKAFLPSISYLRWWWYDRVIEMWEWLSGRFIKNTPLIWLFYRLLGVRMPLRVRIDAFLREFDLIRIVGPEVAIERGIHCRRFGSWEMTAVGNGSFSQRPSVRFRPITIGGHSIIRGHVGIGASIGEGSRVEQLSAIPEGGQVPPNVVALGSPAHQSCTEASVNGALPDNFFVLELMKVAWIMLQICFASMFTTLGSALYARTLGEWTGDWRYAGLLEYAILFVFSTFLGLLTCIPLKWILIGRRRPGDASSEFASLLQWACDYQFRVYQPFFDMALENGVTVNLILKLMGMDIDWQSKVWLVYFPPSKVDLVSVKRSLLSTVSFEVSDPGEGPKRTAVEDCSVGHTVVVTAGRTLRYSEVLPLSRVAHDMIGDTHKWREVQSPLPSVLRKMTLDLAGIPLVLLWAASFVPTYEVFQATSARNDLVHSPSDFPLVRVLLALCMHILTWTFLMITIHKLVFGKKGPWSSDVYFAYMVVMEQFFEFGLVSFLFGTPFINRIMEGLGCSINDNEVWFFGRRLYDSPLISFQGPTIVDTCSLNGHTVSYGKVVFARCNVCGILHEGTVCLANTNIPPSAGGEVGPVCFVSPSIPAKGEERVDFFYGPSRSRLGETSAEDEGENVDPSSLEDVDDMV